MEVHHHPHVEKKSFKEYFLEFLMIFLAANPGIVAEPVNFGNAFNNIYKDIITYVPNAVLTNINANALTVTTSAGRCSC